MSSAAAGSGTRASGRQRLQRQQLDRHHLDGAMCSGPRWSSEVWSGPAVVGSSVVGPDLGRAQMVRRRLVQRRLELATQRWNSGRRRNIPPPCARSLAELRCWSACRWWCTRDDGSLAWQVVRHSDAVATSRLGSIEGSVGLSQQLLGRGLVARSIGRDPGAHRQHAVGASAWLGMASRSTATSAVSGVCSGRTSTNSSPP